MEIASLFQHGRLWSFLVLVISIIALSGADMAFVAGNTLTESRSPDLAAISGIVTGAA